MVHDTWFNEYVTSGYLHPVDDYVGNAELTGPDFDIADFAKKTVENCTKMCPQHVAKLKQAWSDVGVTV